MPVAETIVAPATPAGEGAIATLRLSGPACPALACACFARARPPLPRRATLGTYRNRAGQPVDACLYTLFAAPASYTGEAVLEITCHGNPFIVSRLLDDLLDRGCRMAEPGEFTRLAFLHGKMDLSQAEAVADIITARSDAALRAAQRQLEGEVGTRAKALASRLLPVLAAIEAYLDFPEEDLPPEDAEGPLRHLCDLRAEVARLAESGKQSRALREGVRVALAGAPNAGKSSLLNALLGRERALVSAEPGTTRDYLCEPLVLGPYCIQIMDTAGLREAPGAVERLGVARTLELLEGADLRLLVLDSAAALPPPEAPWWRALPPERTLVVANKSDLSGGDLCESVLPECVHVGVSATTGAGLDVLRAKVLEQIERERLVPDEQTLALGARQAALFATVAQHLDEAYGLLTATASTELAATEIRMALEALGDITGRYDNEAMLDALFATFCIGK